MAELNKLSVKAKYRVYDKRKKKTQSAKANCVFNIMRKY